jgi:hypothetical protein
LRFPVTLALLFLLTLVVVEQPLEQGLLGEAVAQIPDVPDVPEAPEGGTGTGVSIVAYTENAFAQLSENQIAAFTVTIVDQSLESTTAHTSAIPLRCEVVNQTAFERGWSVSYSSPGFITRNQVKTTEVFIGSGVRPAPMEVQVEMACRAGGPVDREIGRFTLTARADVYQRFSLQPVGVVEEARPDSDITIRVRVQNSGNEHTRFIGAVTAPEGWSFSDPPTVMVPPESSVVIEIQGFTPRDQLYYYKSANSIGVTYWPEGQENMEQSLFIPATVNGLYLHPGLVPLVVLGMLAGLMLLLLAIFARRTLEEQILGKPMPPWRIPVEREHLKRLEAEDPDEFYIVRYYLMVEEHRSALLWYHHYKRATRKDRKRERLWLRRKKKVDRRVDRIQRRRARLEERLAKVEAAPAAALARRQRRLEAKALRLAWREQRRLLRIHRRSVRRVDRLHGRRVKALEKAHRREAARELKRVAAENKKRAKKGEELLPAPEVAPLVVPEPQYPDLVEVPIPAVAESVLAVRHERLVRRAERQRRAAEARAGRKRTRRGARFDRKVERQVARLPPEPTTHLYDADEFLSEDEVIVQSDRSAVERLLRVPSLEDRDQLRRRRLVMLARVKAAKERGDADAVAAIRAEWREEKRALLGRRKVTASTGGAHHEANGEDADAAADGERPGTASSGKRSKP